MKSLKLEMKNQEEEINFTRTGLCSGSFSMVDQMETQAMVIYQITSH